MNPRTEAVWQAISFTPDPRIKDRIASGKQTAAILFDSHYFNIRKPIILCCYLDSWVVCATVKNVRRCPIQALTAAELERAAFANIGALLAHLKEEKYPASLGTFVTYVEWMNPQGWLVHEAAAAALENEIRAKLDQLIPKPLA